MSGPKRSGSESRKKHGSEAKHAVSPSRRTNKNALGAFFVGNKESICKRLFLLQRLSNI